MGESVTEGTIIKWHKKPGSPVKKDEILFEISTDKVDTEIPSQEEGILTQILFEEGATVDVGKVVAIIETAKTGDATEFVDSAKVESFEEKQPEPLVKEEVAVAQTAVSKSNLIEIPMPKMGESVMEGTVIKWHKKVGDHVKKDETIFEISTDKVDTEVPSPAEGYLAEILVNEQQTVPVGFVVAKLSSDTPVEKREFTVEVVTPSESAMHDVVASMSMPKPESQVVQEVVKKSESSRFYSPLVMNIAQKENVHFDELERIPGTGIGGRVTKKDILDYIEKRKKAPHIQKVANEIQKPVSVSSASEPVNQSTKFQTSFVSGQVERIQVDNIRQKIMQHMINSRDTSVHVAGLVEVDMTAIYKFIKTKREIFEKQEGVKLTYTAFVAHAVVRALKEHPLVNSSIEGNSILQKRFVNLGIAVAMEPNGLIVPNIKNAHEKNVLGLAKSISDLAERARTKKLTPDDISGGTFTITNYGVFGTLFGTPIINQPEVAILGMGSVVKRPVVVEVNGEDCIVVRPMMYLTLSHDHRLVDGMLGGRFLKSIKDNLENFNDKLLF